MNFAARIADAAARFPQQAAIEHAGAQGDRSTTYGSLLERAEQWSGRLTRLGVGRGDRVAILAENDEPWIAAYLGTLRVGAVAVPLDTNYRQDQVATILVHCGARAILVSQKYTGTTGTTGTRVIPIETATDDELRPPMVDMGADEAAVILYTSGTTADPKGVVLTHGNLEAERHAALGVIDCHERDAILGVLPLFHSLAQMANLVVPLSVGARVVFLETVSSASLVGALQERGITIFACVPQFFYLIHQRVFGEVAKSGALRRALFRALLRTNGWLRDHGGRNPGRRWFARVHKALGPHMRLLITGGSRFDPQIGRDLHDLGFTLLNGYGLTETSGAATLQRPADVYTTSVGRPLPGVEVRISNEEILIRGPIIMREYFGRPDATAEAIRDGWLHTGDLGRIDAAGRVYITGRRKEIIVLSSGKNIYPEEIETQYQRSPFIKELCVMGLARPGDPSAERLHAIVVPDADALRARGAVNVRELVRFELENQSVHLPAHKRVLSFDVRMEPLPRTTTGKLRRHEIEKIARAAAASAAAAATPAGRPLSDSEREWLAQPDRAAALELVASTLKRERVPPDANLELDLGLDSMERVELLTALEQQAGATVPSEARATIFTVRQLLEAIERFAGSSGSTPEPRNPGTAEPAWDTIFARADEAAVRQLDHLAWLRASAVFVFIRTARLAAMVLWRLRVSGAHHLPALGPVIITANHQSYLDGFLLTAALPFHTLRRIMVVGAAEYYQTPFARWVARLANIIPVDADANLVDAMRLSAAGLRSGHALILFPEGERTIDGELRPFRKGAAILSAHLGVPIVPVGLDGLYAVWPRGRGVHWRRLLRGRVSVAFAAPIAVPPGAYAQGTAALHDAVEQIVRHLRDNVRT